MTDEDAKTLISERMMAAKKGTGAAFAIVDEGDSLVGSTSLLAIEWQRSLGLVAYWLAPESRGKGVGTRAVAMLSKWSFDALRLARLELRVDIGNEPSQRLAERVGFQREGLIRSSQAIHGERIDECLYSLLPEDPRFANRFAKPS